MQDEVVPNTFSHTERVALGLPLPPKKDMPDMVLEQLPTVQRHIRKLVRDKMETLAQRRRRKRGHSKKEREELAKKLYAFRTRKKTCNSTSATPTTPSSPSATDSSSDDSPAAPSADPQAPDE